MGLIQRIGEGWQIETTGPVRILCVRRGGHLKLIIEASEDVEFQIEQTAGSKRPGSDKLRERKNGTL